MNNFDVNLTNCDREPIHILGKVQSHGFLIAVNSASLQISFVSENVADYLSVQAATLLNLNISELITKAPLVDRDVDFLQLFKLGQSQNGFEIINPYKLKIGDKPFYLIITISGDQFIMEFEPATLAYDIHSVVGRSISSILLNKSLGELLNTAAKEIKNVIGYDRVMIYKFLEDGHGEVVAEVKNEHLEPFFGLHYPASDIPQQARALYKLNFTRIIADVNTSDSPIATFSEEALDLTHSSLRAVSPIHIQYLKNMGVSSSFSISILAKGELWGLIACHNYSPKFIDYKAREGAKLIGQILSSGLEFRQSEEDSENEALLKDAVQELLAQVEKEHDLISALTLHERTIQDVTKASGAAIIYENVIYKVGVTPEDDDLKELFSWAKSAVKESMFHTSQLSEFFHPAKRYADIASGALISILSRELGEMIIWFKAEKLKTVNWAGNPDKPVEKNDEGLTILTPRHSFESWSQTVKNTSEGWSQSEISGVLKIREKIIGVINKKANEIRVLNERLKLAYEELDTFSYTISHDLRTPLTSIKSYTELFLSQNQSIDDKGKKLLDRVVNGADKMGFLINEILKLARVGRSDIEFSKIEMDKMVPEIVTEVIVALNAHHVKIELGACPEVQGDPILLNQVFTNLIGNAVKYSAKTENPHVSISGALLDDEIVYTIRDNGIGIDVNYHDKVFELFKRMENVRDFEGTGVGLAIVKRILEKHNARIWFESELNVGTTFYVAFKK